MANDNEAAFQNVTVRPATAEEFAAQTAVPQGKRSFIKDAFRVVRPCLNRTTLVIALSLASAFGVLAPEKATQLRDIVMMLPQGTGDLVN